MEIYPNLHQIDVPFAGRIVSVYLLLGDRSILVDSGVADSPEKHILPYLSGIGVSPGDLWGVVNTHAHTDHCGGNHQLELANPTLHVLAHERECADVEDPVAGVRAFFDPYRDVIGEVEADAGIRWNVEHLGPGTLVDRPLRDGQRQRLADDWSLDVHHTPGHTLGHLTLYDPRQQAAFVGDAICWKGTITDGRFTQFPPYLDVDACLDTIRKIRSWPLDYLCTSHYSTLRGDEIAGFLDESEAFVVDLDRIVSRVVTGAGMSLGLREITEAVLDIVGGDYVFDICSVSTVDAHLKRLKGARGPFECLTCQLETEIGGDDDSTS
jgi:glyoxylase-like metal-dependent hydrolase (beta-lactamase superfamily II)